MQWRGVWIGVCVAATVVFSAGVAQAEPPSGPMRKLGRGIANLATGWLEVPVEMTRMTEDSGSWAGVSVGLCRGIMRGIGRTVVGALELSTFFIPNPQVRFGPILEPEFIALRDADRW